MLILFHILQNHDIHLTHTGVHTKKVNLLVYLMPLSHLHWSWSSDWEGNYENKIGKITKVLIAYFKAVAEVRKTTQLISAAGLYTENQTNTITGHKNETQTWDLIIVKLERQPSTVTSAKAKTMRTKTSCLSRADCTKIIHARCFKSNHKLSIAECFHSQM